VLPDIAFPSAYDPEEVGESHRDYALPWDRIRAVPHSSTDELQPLVAPLLEAHKQRSQNDPDYAHMLSQLELTKSWSQQDALSLNIEARRARSKKWDDELFTLENIRRKKKGLELYADIEAWKAESEPDTDSELELASSDADEQDQDSEELDEDEDIAETDPMLQEAGYILSDQIRLGEIAKQRQLQLVQLEQQKAS